MGFRLGSKRVGPFRINFGKAGIASVSMKSGPLNFRLWSANGQRGVSSIDTPGMGSVRRSLKTKKQRDRAAAAEAANG